MHEVDARGYGHLVMAWNRAAAGPRPGQPLAVSPGRADRSIVEHRPSTNCETVVLLLPPVAAAEPLAMASLSSERRDYLIYSSGVPGADALAHLCQQLAPRVIIIDAGLARRLGVEPLRLLAHRRPAARWMIGCGGPLLRCAELLLHFEVRGCIEWAQDRLAVARAIDAVMAGELWFPRRVMQWLYLAMLNAARIEAPWDAAHGDGSLVLTGREVEVVSLMREGLTNREIGERLGISVNTVKKHVGHVFEKRGMHHRRQAY